MLLAALPLLEAATLQPGPRGVVPLRGACAPGGRRRFRRCSLTWLVIMGGGLIYLVYLGKFEPFLVPVIEEERFW